MPCEKHTADLGNGNCFTLFNTGLPQHMFGLGDFYFVSVSMSITRMQPEGTCITAHTVGQYKCQHCNQHNDTVPCTLEF